MAKNTLKVTGDMMTEFMKQGLIHTSNFATLKRHIDDNFIIFVTGFSKTHHLHTQWHSSPIGSSINNLIITITPLPRVDLSAFSEASFLDLSDVHKCSCIIERHWLACTGSSLW